MKIIGINGYKRSGKGETAAAIASVVQDNFYEVKEVGFADKLKILAAKTLGFTERSDEECIALMNECKEKWTFDVTARTAHSLLVPQASYSGRWPDARHTLTGREYLQNLGNEARTVFGSDFWVDQVLPKYLLLDNMYPGVDVLAISDLRYPNEAERVLDCGGEVWEVLRPDTGSDGHASEQPLPRHLVTRQLNNNSNLLSLRYQVEMALGL